MSTKQLGSVYIQDCHGKAETVIVRSDVFSVKNNIYRYSILYKVDTIYTVY